MLFLRFTWRLGAEQSMKEKLITKNKFRDIDFFNMNLYIKGIYWEHVWYQCGQSKTINEHNNIKKTNAKSETTWCEDSLCISDKVLTVMFLNQN